MIDARALTGQEIYGVLSFAVLLITFERRAAIARRLAHGDFAAESRAEQNKVVTDEKQEERGRRRRDDLASSSSSSSFASRRRFAQGEPFSLSLSLVAPELLPSPIKSLDAHLVKHRRI